MEYRIQICMKMNVSSFLLKWSEIGNTTFDKISPSGTISFAIFIVMDNMASVSIKSKNLFSTDNYINRKSAIEIKKRFQ